VCGTDSRKGIRSNRHYYKKCSNKKIRTNDEISNGGNYKKMYDSWNIIGYHHIYNSKTKLMHHLVVREHNNHCHELALYYKFEWPITFDDEWYNPDIEKNARSYYRK
jgi:hypothetical protein